MKRIKKGKVCNVKATTVDGINFRSTAEAYCYRALKAENFTALYEPASMELLPALQPKNIKVYLQSTHKRKGKKETVLELRTRPFNSIGYTPDFLIEFDDTIVFVEVKGFPNDAYPLRFKLFMKYLNHVAEQRPEKHFMFFEPHNHSQIDKMVQILKELRHD